MPDYKPKDDKTLLAALIFNNPTMSPKQIMQMFGLKKALEIVNTRELRVIFAKCNQRSWHRLIVDATKIKLPEQQNSFKVLREHLIQFKSTKLAAV